MKTAFITLLIMASSCIWTGQNHIRILINANDQILFEDEYATIDEIGPKLEHLLTCKGWDCPEKKEKEIPFFGKVEVTQAVIAIGTDRGTSYSKYIQVQGEIEAVFNRLWNKVAVKQFGKEYRFLDKEQQKAVEAYWPKRIVDMEPVDAYGNGLYRAIPPYCEIEIVPIEQSAR
jgi:hypothetical protein